MKTARFAGPLGLMFAAFALGACSDSTDPDTLFDEFRQKSVPFVKELSFIDEGLWGFEITDADGYVIAFFRLRNE